MQHTFFQKLILMVLASALAAGFYVVVYEKIIVGANESINGAYQTTESHTPRPTPRRY